MIPHIDIDLSRAQTKDDAIAEVVRSLGGPSWHGLNLDALWDSITGDDINRMRSLIIARLILGSGPQAKVESVVALLKDAGEELALSGKRFDVVVERAER